MLYHERDFWTRIYHIICEANAASAVWWIPNCFRWSLWRAELDGSAEFKTPLLLLLLKARGVRMWRGYCALFRPHFPWTWTRCNPSGYRAILNWSTAWHIFLTRGQEFLWIFWFVLFSCKDLIWSSHRQVQVEFHCMWNLRKSHVRSGIQVSLDKHYFCNCRFL